MQFLHAVHYFIFKTFAIIIGIGSYFLYFYWYLRKDVICVKFGIHTQQFNELINRKKQTNRDQNSSLLFLQ